jgi:selenocysteine lyase/cysteine desulfurase
MVSRRTSLKALLASPWLGLRGGGEAQAAPSIAAASFKADPGASFQLDGVYLNAAYTHPMPLNAAAAVREYLVGRSDPARRKPAGNTANALFAQLVNASPDEIAGVPSTSYAESFVIGALGLQGDRRARIVTDILHFDGSLYSYGELARQGSPVTVLPMTPGGRIDMNRLEAAVDRQTRLVAISLVSMVNGFEHDLKTVCDIAHRLGAHVYVDAIQAAGAVPIDVKASGVDFLACSTFKWLMGDFGYGFLYVRQDLIPKLRRTEFGYHQPARIAYHAFPGDPPGAALFEASPDEVTAAGRFEVGSLGTAAEVAAGVSLQNILDLGVDEIQRRRQPLIERLRRDLSGAYAPLTPPDSRSGIITFVARDAAAGLRPRLKEAGVNLQVYENRFRVSPSVYNTMADVERAIEVLTA